MRKLQDLLRDFDPFPFEDFREKINIGKFKKKTKYTYIGPDGKRYDIRNKLNNLSGDVWTYFLNTIEITNYPTKGPRSYAHSIRRKCPSPKPPQLMKKIIRFFTKNGGWVLDPFVGVGGTLLGASLCRRNAVGLDICEEYIEVYRAAANELDLKEQIAVVLDSRKIDQFCEGIGEYFDLVLTDPPYCNIQARPKTGDKSKKGEGEPTPFTMKEGDIGNLGYDEYLQELKNIIEKTILFLKSDKYLVVFIKDIQPTRKHRNILHADIVSTLLQIDELEYRGYKIWFDKTQNLYPFGYPYQYVSNQFHQFILIFRKV